METILIVDDEPEMLGVAVDMLQAKGHTTLQTGDPLEALRIARTEAGAIDLLLSDVVMPHGKLGTALGDYVMVFSLPRGRK